MKSSKKMGPISATCNSRERSSRVDLLHTELKLAELVANKDMALEDVPCTPQLCPSILPPLPAFMPYRISWGIGRL
jgi:hypothetical protein